MARRKPIALVSGEMQELSTSDVFAGVAVQSVTSAATVTPDMDSNDMVRITAQAAALTMAAPTGSPVEGQALVIRIKDNGTARSITWNAIYRAIGCTLPTTTVISKTTYVVCIYNASDTKYDVVNVMQEA